MDPEKQPGIVFQGVYLTELHFRLAAKGPEELRYDLALDVSSKIEDGEDGGKRLFITLRADPMSHLAEKPFEMRIVLVGVFEAVRDSNLPLEEFAEKQAPALLVPYLREVIANITSRSTCPALVLPPLNVHALIEASRRSKKELASPAK